MLMDQGALFWLLDVKAHGFDMGVLRDTDLSGRALIVSRQLWSLIRGNKVVSILVGPGIFKGVAESGPRRVDVLEYISALIFDPTQLRYDEPLPFVDIVNPEVIDPLSAARSEDIYSVIRKLILEKGNILAADPLARIKYGTGVPETAHYDERMKKIRITHVSGVQRAKFILAGTNSPLYRPFVQRFEKGKYNWAKNSKVLATPFDKFSTFDDEDVLGEWMIVEKAGRTDKVGIPAIDEEYASTLSIVEQEKDAFIYEL